MTRTITLVLALSLSAVGVVAACGGRAGSSATVVDDEGGAADQDSGLPPGVDHYQGYVACCSADAGDCCVEKSEYCEPYMACVGPGQPWQVKGPECEACCAGLTMLRVVRENADGTCDRDAGFQLEPDYVCAACGNGICEKTSGENHCGCPADCP